jgi:hypothetical protein
VPKRPRRPKDEPATTAAPDAAVVPDKAAEESRRPGLPAPESVVSESTFVSPKGNTYRIIRTNETDPGDEVASPPPKRTKKPKPGPPPY